MKTVSHISPTTLALILLIVVHDALAFNTTSSKVPYSPTWASLDSRPLPPWYDEAKLGIFIVWGVYSVPSFGDEWFWDYWRSGKKEYVEFMEKNYAPDFTYPDFASQFTAEFYDPDEWADLIEASGAKYVVLTTKHHDGYTLWPSNASFNWNSMDVGPKRDLVGDLAQAISKKEDIHLGLYHSLFEWFNPLFVEDQARNFTTRTFQERKSTPELYELVNTYKPDVIWSDGNWLGGDDYWKSTDFLAWLYNDSPVKDTVVVNDRWSDSTPCKHGGYYTCTDRYNPGKLQKHKWENAMTIDKKSWGFRREAPLADYLSIQDILKTFAETVSCGGNMLMNVGPTKEGTIRPIFEERLRQLGAWLKVNGEAIYSSVPWKYQQDETNKDVWYTARRQPDGSYTGYAILLQWPSDHTLVLGSPAPVVSSASISMVGLPGVSLRWIRGPTEGIIVDMPVLTAATIPCKYAWVIKLEGF